MSHRGMTLLEVMVALAIFAVAGLALMRTVSQQALNLGAFEEKTLATWVADNLQVELKLQGNWPESSWVSGQEEMAGRKWFWRWQGVDTSDDNFRAIDVEVRTDEKAKDPRVTLRTYVSR